MKARIKNTPFEYDVEPWFENGLFRGFAAKSEQFTYHFNREDLVFPEDAEIVSPLAPPEPDFRDQPFGAALIENKPAIMYISNRLFNLIRAKLDKDWEEITIRDIISIPRIEWLKCRNFGKKCLSELDNIIKELGLWQEWTQNR